MRLLADENFPRAAVEALHVDGHDVVWVQETSPGEHDRNVLANAQSASRFLITFDKGFGELSLRMRLAGEYGIILVRYSSQAPKYVTPRIVELLGTRDNWIGRFAVVSDHGIRMRPLLNIASQDDD